MRDRVPAPSAETDGEAVPKTLADLAYVQIRADIISGTLQAGCKLRLESVGQRYHISMSPLREALSRLASDTLVVSKGQRGFWVAPLSLAELDDLTRVRGLVEIEALQLSLQNGDLAWEEQVRRVFAELCDAENRFRKEGDQYLRAWELANQHFHEALVAACASPWLIRLQRQLYAQSERYRRVSLQAHSPLRCVHDEHVALFEAAVARQVLKASRIAELHLRNTALTVRNNLSRIDGFTQTGETKAVSRGEKDEG